MSRRNRSHRIGLYFGDVTHLSGLWAYWVHALGAMGREWTPLWDHSFGQANTLRGVDAVVVPGGFCWSANSAFGGADGRRRLRNAVQRGVTYIGTCYGASVAMASGQGRRVCRLGLVRGRALDGPGTSFRGVTRIDYHCEAPAYEANTQVTKHINGPLFARGHYDVIGRFSSSQPGPFETRPARQIAGLPAAIAAACGRGRVFLFSSHPEVPIDTDYETCLPRVARGELAPPQAARKLRHPPGLSSENLRLLKGLFDALPRVAGQRRDVAGQEWLSQQAALLSSAKELLKLRFQELELQLEKVEACARTPSLQFACAIAHRRLRQAHHIVGRIDVDALWKDATALARVSTCFVLQRLSCGCDHPGRIPEARLDYLVAEAAKLRLPRKTRRADRETRVAKMVFRTMIKSLDSFIYVGHGLDL